MTTSRTEGTTIFVSLEVSIEYDGRAGYLVCEKDGPQTIKWGPMPHYLVDAFILERGECIAKTWRRMAEDMHARVARQRHA